VALHILRNLLLIAAIVPATYVAMYAIVIFYSVRRIHSKQTLSALPQRVETSLDHLTPEMREFIGRVVTQLHAKGFLVLSNSYMAHAAAGATAVQVVLVHPQERHTATIYPVQSKFARSLSFMITSTFRDGRRFATALQKAVSGAAKDPRVDAINFPWVNDGGLLYEAHCRRLAASKWAADQRIVPDERSVAQWLDDNWKREVERAASRGNIYLDAPAGVYRYTSEARARVVWRKLLMDAVAPSAEPSFATPNVEAAPEREVLNYDAGLAPGEIRTLRTSGSLVVKVGGKSAKQYLLQNSFQLGMIAFFAAVFSYLIFKIYLIWSFMPVIIQFNSAVLWLPAGFLLFVHDPVCFQSCPEIFRVQGNHHDNREPLRTCFPKCPCRGRGGYSS
jgi:hypothetical protein